MNNNLNKFVVHHPKVVKAIAEKIVLMNSANQGIIPYNETITKKTEGIHKTIVRQC